MYHHVKQLMYTVRIGVPDPHFGNMLLEQFGGANGELAAAMQYSVQGLNCDLMDNSDLSARTRNSNASSKPYESGSGNSLTSLRTPPLACIGSARTARSSGPISQN